jgi:hypothetical protein
MGPGSRSLVARLSGTTGGGMHSHSRDMICPSFAISLSLSVERAQGKPGADCARSTVCNGERNAHGLDRYSRDIPAFPAQWFDGLYVLSPGKRPFLPPLPAGLTANVAPGSRRQDHTTSPYAAHVSSGERARLTPQRPSHPGPTFRDDREAPLKWPEVRTI